MLAKLEEKLDFFLFEERIRILDLEQAHKPVKDGIAVEMLEEVGEGGGVVVKVLDDLFGFIVADGDHEFDEIGKGSFLNRFFLFQNEK